MTKKDQSKFAMPEKQPSNLAEIAAQKALSEMFQCIRARQNFRLEAGAGAGKTYSLVKALKLIINEQGGALQRNSQQVACITFTNVATDEIKSRTDGNPVVRATTIHNFCWEMIKSFQPFLKEEISKIEGWPERIEEVSGVGHRTVHYELGYRRVTDTHLHLRHDDVLTLIASLMEKKKFRYILTTRFPILLIDEYQDTNMVFANSIRQYFIDSHEGPLIGLFGDSWQKIYGNGVGLIDHENLKFIGKEANFRSVNCIVGALKRIRPNLPQNAKDGASEGSIAVYHTNTWVGIRRSGSHWNGDLPHSRAHIYLSRLRKLLSDNGWEFESEKTKILMLTHSALAAEQSYERIAKIFKYNDSFIKKEDPHIAFLVDVVEPACSAFQDGRYGEMFDVIGRKTCGIRSFRDKQSWARDMRALIGARSKGTIGDVIDLLKTTNRPKLPEVVEKIELELKNSNPESIEESMILRQIDELHKVSYQQLISLTSFVNNHTPFSTKHGVKGAEFENVLVVFGRGWNHYDWNRFLELAPDGIPAGQAEFFERNRNLFYVACSRPKKRLVLLFTQKLSSTALATLHKWFGQENVLDAPSI